jgi:hypothetical protein
MYFNTKTFFVGSFSLPAVISNDARLNPWLFGFDFV